MMADDLRSEMEKGFSRVDNEFAAVRADIKQSADDSRRYFQILTEQIRDSVKLVAEATSHNTSRLDDHEQRLTTLQKSRRA